MGNYCWLVSISLPSDAYTECDMQGDHKYLIKFDKEKDLHPVFYKELVLPLFDTYIPNESNGSEEEPEAILFACTFVRRRK